jgi:hypothetical protein
MCRIALSNFMCIIALNFSTIMCVYGLVYMYKIEYKHILLLY